MIKKEDLPYDKNHVAIPLDQAIGQWVLCEDGVRRQIERIAHCVGSFNLCVINEDLDKEISGHSVHLLKLFHELRHQPPPTEEEIKQFDEIAKSWTYKYVRDKPSPKKMNAIFKTVEKASKKNPHFSFLRGRKGNG